MSLNTPRIFTASGNIPPSRFVKMAGNNIVALCGANEQPCGISTEKSYDAPIPQQGTVYAGVDGKNIEVYPLGAACKLEAGTGGFTYGDNISSDANGKGIDVTADAAGRIGAWAITSAAAGELGDVQVIRMHAVANNS